MTICHCGSVPFTVCLSPTTDRAALPVDIFESDGAITIEGSIPGVRREDVAIAVRGNIISIQARPRPATQRHRRYVRRERYAGGWSRTIELPLHVAPGAMTWRLQHGIVALRIVKHAPLTPDAPAGRVRQS